MVSNPMQRKSRNSFILGLILGLLITGAIAAFFAYQIKLMKDEEVARLKKEKLAYVLQQDVKSGEEITPDLYKKVSVTSDAIPGDTIDANSLPENVIAKIDLKKGTIISQSSITESEQKETDDMRIQEYNMLKLSSQVQSGDYIDIRLRMPSGLDYIVISKKKVEIPEINGIQSDSTIWLRMTEEETLIMSEAIVENYMIEGSILYTTNYVDPGLQKEANITYVPSESTINLITHNPNVVSEAAQAIYNMYAADSTGIRGKISNEINKDIDNSENNVKSKSSNEVNNAKTLRKSYLDSLAGE